APAQIRRGNPIRLVAFITDGEVGNDMEVLAAVKQYRGTARVFSFAIGDSPNRYLLDGMARLGRGEVDYVPNNSDPREVIARFTRRVATPVLTDIHATFSPNIQPVDVLTALGGGGGSGERVSDFEAIPDLYDQKPVVIVGRYNASGAGTLTITGNTAAGPWSKVVNVTLPASENKNSAIPTLWARTKVESIMDANLVGAQRDTMAAGPRGEIVSLGESFNIVTQYTSFVAVDRLRVTIGGQPRLVQIPVDFPQGAEWSGYFGGGRRGGGDEYSDADRDDLLDSRMYDIAAYGEGIALGFVPIGGVHDSLGLSELMDYPAAYPSQDSLDSAAGFDAAYTLNSANPSDPSALLLRDAQDGKLIFRRSNRLSSLEAGTTLAIKGTSGAIAPATTSFGSVIATPGINPTTPIDGLPAVAMTPATTGKDAYLQLDVTEDMLAPRGKESTGTDGAHPEAIRIAQRPKSGAKAPAGDETGAAGRGPAHSETAARSIAPAKPAAAVGQPPPSAPSESGKARRVRELSANESKKDEAARNTPPAETHPAAAEPAPARR
ncbi:MAG: hypothetical protein IAF94_12990, partial [Pirellulaceae bacterium]|nr:hypothetical protein [Pirellulaceae bacterium]